MNHEINKPSVLHLFPHGKDIAVPVEIREMMLAHFRNQGLTANAPPPTPTLLRIISLAGMSAGPQLQPHFVSGERLQVSNMNLEKLHSIIAVLDSHQSLSLALIDVEFGDTLENLRTAVRHDVDAIILGMGKNKISQEVDEYLHKLSITGHIVVCIEGEIN